MNIALIASKNNAKCIEIPDKIIYLYSYYYIAYQLLFALFIVIYYEYLNSYFTLYTIPNN